ncbi:hypothetical protein PR048_017214 [Dryococelus australis]|uniref:Tesmin/TSO1-like CXC domain-containing protein n=1 Tax=Dryococelus australis TaxID=614101 RepID=A0ABQ9H8W7_9NEOP|nr:hypothetical protein PR048_017214 [Dryococelus australis]
MEMYPRCIQKLLNGDRVLHSCASAFILPGKNPAGILSLGSQAMAVIFGGNSTSSLAALHYQTLTERLPPTESSTKFHHTIIWMSMAREINPVNWGLKLDGEELVPVICDMNAAPETLLKIIHCNCKSDCSSNRCSCRAYGLPCSYVCGSCQVTHCDNQLSDELEDSVEVS